MVYNLGHVTSALERSTVPALDTMEVDQRLDAETATLEVFNSIISEKGKETTVPSSQIPDGGSIAWSTVSTNQCICCNVVP
jgi:hypothetical protein